MYKYKKVFIRSGWLGTWHTQLVRAREPGVTGAGKHSTVPSTRLLPWYRTWQQCKQNGARLCCPCRASERLVLLIAC